MAKKIYSVVVGARKEKQIIAKPGYIVTDNKATARGEMLEMVE